ncbi:hypothetical protein Q5N75_19005, partial [Acinetobacter baumannii]|uniref:hypothetical protein n=2 Tax=Acinetobacter baumannii TaxID=470 RepID=UPI00208F9754
SCLNSPSDFIITAFFLLYSAYSKLQNDAYHWKCTTVCNTSWARLNIAEFNDISMYIVGLYG